MGFPKIILLLEATVNRCFLQSEREQEAENLEGEKVKAYVYAYIALLCDRCEYLKVNILFW